MTQHKQGRTDPRCAPFSTLSSYHATLLGIISHIMTIGRKP